jgi:hypothetical protein
MTEEWKWASVKRIKEAAEELKSMIRAKYPDAQFRLLRDPDDRDGWLLWTLVDVEDRDEVNDVVREREQEMLVEERIPILVVPTRSRNPFFLDPPKAEKRAG